ncbi:hypothetical protein HDR63_01005 [bacterium]|nr:hypothetical protein [bacterium]
MASGCYSRLNVPSFLEEREEEYFPDIWWDRSPANDTKTNDPIIETDWKHKPSDEEKTIYLASPIPENVSWDVAASCTKLNGNFIKHIFGGYAACLYVYDIEKGSVVHRASPSELQKRIIIGGYWREFVLERKQLFENQFSDIDFVALAMMRVTGSRDFYDNYGAHWVNAEQELIIEPKIKTPTIDIHTSQILNNYQLNNFIIRNKTTGKLELFSEPGLWWMSEHGNTSSIVSWFYSVFRGMFSDGGKCVFAGRCR